MASWMYFSFCIIASFFVHTVDGAQLTITPQEITVGGQNPTLHLNGTCTPNAPGITTLYDIEIGRRKLGTDTAIVQIGNTDTAPNIKDLSLQSRLTVSGSINGAIGSLQFSLKDPTCTDVDTTFYCTTLYTAASGSGSDETTKNISARTYPGTIRMIPSPDRVQYNPPVLVEFTCTGLIGNTFPTNQANFWQWQWRSVGDINTQWTTYPYSANITYRTPSPSGSCNYNGGSTLTHTVTDLDNGRQFRCSVVNDQYSDNKTVYTQAPPVSPGTDQVEEGGTASADAGMIAGIVIGVLAAIALVVVLVYFLVFRKRSGGDDYDTGEGKVHGAVTTDNDVYSTPGSRENKPHRKQGRENEAMDEPQEKPRPYYENNYGDRDRGRANPAMDDDSRHDRSYDDDNTDSRMRSPYGSAV